MTGTRGLSNKTDLKDNAYQTTSQENMCQTYYKNQLEEKSLVLQVPGVKELFFENVYNIFIHLFILSKL